MIAAGERYQEAWYLENGVQDVEQAAEIYRQVAASRRAEPALAARAMLRLAACTRHLGREAFEKLIDPMASGVFAGDARKMSVKSCFPRINEVEAEYRSLILGLIKLQKEARRAGKKDTPGPGPGGNLTSFNAGMSVLTDALTVGMGSRVRVNSAVNSISRSGGQYTLHLANGTSEDFDAVILAVPAYAQAKILKELAPDLSNLVDDIQYPSLSVVCLGYSEEQAGGCMDGFGFLVPSREKRGILGTVVD